jgi:hypothetical protein
MKETTPAVLIRRFHRWSGLALILLVSLKLISGFRLAGAIGFPAEAAAGRMHFSAWVDAPLMFFFIFHAAYGILKILMPKISRKAGAFLFASIAAFLVFLTSILSIYSGH